LRGRKKVRDSVPHQLPAGSSAPAVLEKRTLYVAESDGTEGAIGIVTAGGTIQTYATFAGVPTFIADPSVSLVPEPLSMGILALGAIGMLSHRRRGR
jgi:hypothetical protein